MVRTLDEGSREALKSAPELIHYVRAIALGSPERGETLHEWNAPMRITAADAADSVFAQLVDWRTYWQRFIETVQVEPRRIFVARGTKGNSTTIKPWSGSPVEVQGFAAGTSADLAGILTRVQTRWLLAHADQINLHPYGREYQHDVTRMINKLRRSYEIEGKLDPYANENADHGRVEYDTNPKAVKREIRLLMVKPYLLPSEAAILVRKSKSQINRMISNVEDPLRTYSHEGKRYVRLEDVREWIETHSTRDRS